MLIGIFKSNQKLVNIVVILLTAVLWAPSFFMELPIEVPKSFVGQFKWIGIVISILLISGQSIYLNIIVNEYKLVKENSHLTSLIFLVYCSGSLLLLNFNQVVISNTFVMLAFHQLLRLYSLKNSYSILFNAGFLIAIASLIYLPSLVYFILIWITLAYTTTPKWRDFIISLIGLFIPILYFLTFEYVFVNLTNINNDYFKLDLFKVSWKELSLFHQAFFVLQITILLMAISHLLSSLNRNIARVRKMLIVVVLMLFIGLMTWFMNGYDYIATYLMLSVPVSIIIAKFFQGMKKKWLAELFFLILMVVIMIGYFS